VGNPLKMQFLDQCFFGGAFTSGIGGGGMDTAGFTVIFLTSSSSQSIFLDIGAATLFTTKCMHPAHLVQRTTAVCIIPLPKSRNLNARPTRASSRPHSAREIVVILTVLAARSRQLNGKQFGGCNTVADPLV
jgi:hypothetical protein